MYWKQSVSGELFYCCDLIQFLFLTPQEENPVRGEIVLSSNDLQLVLQVERNQWVLFLSYPPVEESPGDRECRVREISRSSAVLKIE